MTPIESDDIGVWRTALRGFPLAAHPLRPPSSAYPDPATPFPKATGDLVPPAEFSRGAAPKGETAPSVSAGPPPATPVFCGQCPRAIVGQRVANNAFSSNAKKRSLPMVFASISSAVPLRDRAPV